MLPDSPRFLASVGRNEEAREVLESIRKHKASPEEIDREYLEIIALAEESQLSSPIQFAKILIGRGSKRHPNLGRRAWLCMFLQIMASWTGITVGASRWHVFILFLIWSIIGRHGVRSSSLVPSRIPHDHAERSGWRTQHGWHCRYHNQCPDCRPPRSPCLSYGRLSSVIFCQSNCTSLLTMRLRCASLIICQAGAVYEGALHNPNKASEFAPAAVAMLFLFNIG